MNKKPYIIPSKTNNKNMERYLQRKLSEVGEGGGGGGGSDPEAIKYTEQTLTAEQQAQARANIDAYKKPDGGIPSSDLEDGIHIITYPQGSYSQIEDWVTSDDKLIILDVHGQPYLFAGADDNECYTFIGIDIYGHFWKYAIDEHDWLTPSPIPITIESMTAQEVATAVDTAWTNVMGS